MNVLLLRRLASFCSALALCFAAGCGGDRTEELPEEEFVVEDTETPPTMAADPAVGTEGFVLTPADLDSYERGMRGELEALHNSQERIRQARSGADTLAAMSIVVGNQLQQEGARAAGVPLDRYQQITTAVDGVLGKREMGTAMQGDMARIAEDTVDLPPEARAQVRENLRQMQTAWGDPYAGLTPEAAEALRARADELARLRAERLGALTTLVR